MALSAAAVNALGVAMKSRSLASEINTAIDTLDELSATEVGYIDGVTAGTAAASKAMVLDSNSELNSLGVMKVTDTLISSAEVLALNATPITVVAAAGSGVYLEFLGAYIFLDYNSAAYADDAGEDLVFKNTDASGDEVSARADGGLFDGTADALVYVPAMSNFQSVVAFEMPENSPIVLHLLTGEWLTGDSPLKVRVYYREVRSASMAAIA